MVVFVDLAHRITKLEMHLVVVGPVLLAAVARDAAVRALEPHVRGWGGGGATLLTCFRVVGRSDNASLTVGWMRAVGMGFDEGGAATDPRGGRCREMVEQVGLFQFYVFREVDLTFPVAFEIFSGRDLLPVKGALLLGW